VLSDLFGTTGRNLIEKLYENQSAVTEQDIAVCACGRLQSRVPELHRSVHGFFEDHHRFPSGSLMRITAMLESEMEILTERISGLMQDYDDTLSRLQMIPGHLLYEFRKYEWMPFSAYEPTNWSIALHLETAYYIIR
jgi:hypothetical protein